jgi:hypothetical protein
VKVSKLMFEKPVGTLADWATPAPGTIIVKGAQDPLAVYVLDRRVVATHYIFPTTRPASGQARQLRLFPAPLTPTPANGRIAVETEQPDGKAWELLAVKEAPDAEAPQVVSQTRLGLIVDIDGPGPAGEISTCPASGNVVRVRHGVTSSARLDSGDGHSVDHRLVLPDSPVAAQTDLSGTPVSSLTLRVDGRAWTEEPTLFDRGPAECYETRIGPAGELQVRFGDGIDGAIPKGGTANVAATYRVGGGLDGEVGTGEIDTLLGSIRGVRSVIGAGATGNGADQSSEHELRREAPTRARAMDRVVALLDLADVALAFPGVSHAAAWIGAGPPAQSCPPGPHVAVLRRGSAGVRGATDDELSVLAAYLDARRDVTVPLCVVSAEAVAVRVALTVAVDARYEPAAVRAAVEAIVLSGDGPLAPARRSLGRSLDRSDVVSVVHGVEGVDGVVSLDLSTQVQSADDTGIGRLLADRYQLLVISPNDLVVTS